MTRKQVAGSIAGVPRRSLVCVVEDDASVRAGLASLFGSVGHEVAVFDSAAAFLTDGLQATVGCLVIDIRHPGINGLQFQTELSRAGSVIPIVFMTGHADVPMSVEAMKRGAVDFLEKPFRDQDMLDAVAVALERDRQRRESDQAAFAVRSAFETLTPREREVMALVTGGLMNKQIAAEIGLSEITVKIHRGHLMRKMGARSVAELVRMADLLAIPSQSRLGR